MAVHEREARRVALISETMLPLLTPGAGAPTSLDANTGRGFFADVHGAFQQAERLAQSRPDVYFRLADRVLRLRFAGSSLVPLLAPAFAHLACARTEAPDLTIACWDDASTGVRTPEPPPSGLDGGIDFLDGPTVQAAWEPARGALAAFDRARGLALLRFPDARSVPVHEQAAPARRILHWWALRHELQFVHAAAIGTARGGILLVGRGGSGKSTTALACVGSALGYAADDYCLVSLNGEPRVHSVYNTGKADTASWARLPRLQAAFAASPLREDGKTAIFIARESPESMLATFALRAVVVPRITGRSDSRFVPLSPAAALRAVAPSTLFQLPGDRGGTLTRLAALVRTLPCHELQLGTDPAEALRLVADLLEGAPQ